jgi:putative membrane protein insertion efficiency factor
MKFHLQVPLINIRSIYNSANGFLRLSAHGLIRAYQLTLSSLIGRQCRHLPTCSDYMDEAVEQHGFWAGGWIGLSRVCRCHPWGTAGFDPVPSVLPRGSHWAQPWRYGRWHGPLICEPCNEARPSKEKA